MPVVAAIDTSVWVSAFLNPDGHPARLIQAGKAGGFAIVGSLPLLEELAEVLTRPRIMRVRQTSEKEAETFVASVAAVMRLVAVAGDLRLCRDPQDDLILETAMSGEATYVISRDEDITRDPELASELSLRGIEAVTVRQFLALLQQTAAGPEANQP